MVAVMFAFLGETISFENPGIRLELFLKEVSKQSGVGFHCPTYLNNEVLAASFKDQSIGVLKSQLARVIHGTWEQKEDGWWLVQSSDQRKEEEKWVWETRNKVLQHQIDGLKAVAPRSEWTTNEAEKYWIDIQAARKKTGEAPWTAARRSALRMRSPEARLCASIAAKLTVNMLTENPLRYNGNRYSVRGLPGHIELPINLGNKLQQYEIERQRYLSLSQTAEEQNIFDRQREPVHLELQYSSLERGYLFFSWWDKDWKAVGSGMPTIFLNNKVFQAQGESFPLSKETQEIANLQREISSGMDAEPMFEKHKDSPLLQEAVSTMFNATQRDPLGIMQGRCWIEFAKYVKKPLLVSLKDDDGVLRPSSHVPTVIQKEFVLGMMRDDIDGWVLGRPINPMFNRAWRMDRKLIEEYARLTKARNSGNIYPSLQIARINSTVDFFTAGIPNAEFLLDDQRYSGYFTALFGYLDEQQLNACLRGDRIPVSSLSSKGQEFMSILARDGSLTELTPLMDDESSDLNPLYYLPNGTKGMWLGASFKIQPEFHFEIEPAEDIGTDMDIASFAALLKTAKSGDPIFDAKFTVSSNRVFVGTVYLGGKSKSESLSIPIGQGRMPTYTWKTLPDSTREQVLDEMKKPVK
jgi:hypothetical protein